MNSFTRIASYLFVLVLVVGCASTDVTEQSNMSAEPIPKPGHIYVYPFASMPADIPSWSVAAGRYAQPDELPTPEEIEAGRKLGALVAKDLAVNIRKMGLPALEGNQQTHLRVNDLLLIGYFEAIDEGSAAKRVVLGFGSGGAELATVVEGYQMTPQGPRHLGSGVIQSSGSKTPGTIVPLAVFAATSNPIALIVSGSAKVAGEATGKSTIEGAAKRTADEVAERLQIRFKRRGWIR